MRRRFRENRSALTERLGGGMVVAFIDQLLAEGKLTEIVDDAEEEDDDAEEEGR